MLHSWSLIEAAGQVDRQGTRSDELREQIVALRAEGLAWTKTGAQVGREDITTTNRIYRYVLRRKARGEIGARRQLLRALPPIPDGSVDAVMGVGDTMSDARNKGR